MFVLQCGRRGDEGHVSDISNLMSFKGKKHTKAWKVAMSERTRIRMSTPEARERAREIASRPRPNARGPNPNKARWGNQNVLGKRWKAPPITEMERARRTAQIIAVRPAKPALGKHWTLSEQTKQRISQALKGRKPHPKSGWGKHGYRADIGHFVRSRWEANFARILQHLGVAYEFEKTTVRFPDGRAYRPDFWVPELQCHIEIKGYETTESERKHRQTLQQGIPVFIIDGSRYHILERKYASQVPGWETS